MQDHMQSTLPLPTSKNPNGPEQKKDTRRTHLSRDTKEHNLIEEARKRETQTRQTQQGKIAKTLAPGIETAPQHTRRDEHGHNTG